MIEIFFSSEYSSLILFLEGALNKIMNAGRDIIKRTPYTKVLGNKRKRSNSTTGSLCEYFPIYFVKIDWTPPMPLLPDIIAKLAPLQYMLQSFIWLYHFLQRSRYRLHEVVDTTLLNLLPDCFYLWYCNLAIPCQA